MSQQAVRLGEFLRARRARVRPAEVGLPAGTGLRRTPGLRREELAALAGVSVDYLIRLEQGREYNPSPGVLDALAGALRLNEEEHAHLYALARHAASRTVPAPARRPGDRIVRPGIRQLLDTVRPYPAYVLSRYSDVLAINPEGLALFVGLGDWPQQRRNTVRYFFLHPVARQLFPDWEKLAIATAASLHSLAALDPQAPELLALVDELTADCPEFAELWQRHEIRERHGERKAFRHPVAGEFTLESEILRFGEDGQRITLYQAAPGTSDHAALLRLKPSPPGAHPQR